MRWTGAFSKWKKTLLGQHLWPLLHQRVHEGAQDLHNVTGVDNGAPGLDVGVIQVLVVEECQQNLFCAARVDPCLYGPRLTLLYPLFSLPFCLRCVVRQYRLVHGDYAV